MSGAVAHPVNFSARNKIDNVCFSVEKSLFPPGVSGVVAHPVNFSARSKIDNVCFRQVGESVDSARGRMYFHKK